MTTAGFAQRTEFSLGGSIGSMVQQKIIQSYDTTTINALPELGLTADLRFYKIGFQLDFGFSWQSLNYYESSSDTEQTNEAAFLETITLTPYIPFDIKDFTFIVGPTIGFTFVQAKFEAPYSDYTVEVIAKGFGLVMGGTFGVRYWLTDHTQIFLDIPVLYTPYTKQTQLDYSYASYKDSENLPDGSWTDSTIYVVPKIGLVYTF